jgi:hypothetical protein
MDSQALVPVPDGTQDELVRQRHQLSRKRVDVQVFQHVVDNLQGPDERLRVVFLLQRFV